MIDGLKLDVTADEIVKLLDERINELVAGADADESNAQKLAHTDDTDDDCVDEVTVGTRLRRRAQRERDRADALTFMRNHVVRGETYRLTSDDLRTLELLPNRYY